MVDKIMTMGRIEWTENEKQYLRNHYLNTSADVIAKALGRKRSSVISAANRLGLVKRSHYSKAEVEFIMKHYQTHSSKEIGAMLGRTVDSVQCKIKQLKIRKNYVCKFNSTWFKKGNDDWRKNRKCRPIGTIVTRADNRNGKRYQYIKIKRNEWLPLGRYVWQKHHGNIPPKHYIRFKDGNPENCNIDNLMMVSEAENVKMNIDYKKAVKTKARNKHGGFFNAVLLGVV